MFSISERTYSRIKRVLAFLPTVSLVWLMKIIYLNCGIKNEHVSDPQSYEHYMYLSSSENPEFFQASFSLHVSIHNWGPLTYSFRIHMFTQHCSGVPCMHGLSGTIDHFKAPMFRQHIIKGVEKYPGLLVCSRSTGQVVSWRSTGGPGNTRKIWIHGEFFSYLNL